jgi:opacity protein-like surface antigen
MKQLLIFFVLFFLIFSQAFGEENQKPEPIPVQDHPSFTISPGTGGKTGGEKTWDLTMGIHSSYFQMQKNRGELFRNINLLNEEQDYVPFKPSVQIHFLKYLGVEVYYDHFKAAALNRAFDIYPEHDRRWTDGFVEWSPLMMTLHFHWPMLNNKLIPYVLGGMSYTKTSWQRNDWYYYGFPSLEVYNQWTGQGLKPEDYPNAGYRRIFATDDHCLGALLGLGLDYYFCKNLALNLDWRYHWAKVKFTYTLAYDDGQVVVGRDGGTFHLDAWILSLGLKYLF